MAFPEAEECVGVEFPRIQERCAHRCITSCRGELERRGRVPTEADLGTCARITVETNDGRTLEHFQANRKGDPELPLSDAELAAKYTELAAPVMGDAGAASLLDALWALDGLASVRRLPIGMETSAVRAG